MPAAGCAYKRHGAGRGCGIQNSPRKPIGDTILESSPAGTASIRAARNAAFQSMVLASRMASVQCSGGACPGTASAEYTSEADRRQGNSTVCLNTWWQRVRWVSIHLRLRIWPAVACDLCRRSLNPGGRRLSFAATMASAAFDRFFSVNVGGVQQNGSGPVSAANRRGCGALIAGAQVADDSSVARLAEIQAGRNGAGAHLGSRVQEYFNLAWEDHGAIRALHDYPRRQQVLLQRPSRTDAENTLTRRRHR